MMLTTSGQTPDHFSLVGWHSTAAGRLMPWLRVK